MNPEYVQNFRYKLQKRVSRLNSVDSILFGVSLTQFWNYFEQQPVFLGILEELIAQIPDLNETIERIENEPGVVGESEKEAAAIGYRMLKRLVDGDGDYNQKLAKYSQKYNRAAGNNYEKVETIREVFLEPFYEYVDEQLDDQRAMLALLIRYKHRSEWFNNKNLFKLSEESKFGEKNLALDLYAYLYDQGIEFTIEPSSITGEVDLIAAQDTQDPLLLDAKIFDGDSRGKAYICKGFNQIYTYTRQYNEPFGYLIIYKTTEKDLHFALPTSAFSDIPVITYNYKTIFFNTIDINQYDESVSQRKSLQAVEISQDDLITSVPQENP